MCYVILPEQLPLSAPAETKSLVIGTQSSGQFAFEITYGTRLGGQVPRPAKQHWPETQYDQIRASSGYTRRSDCWRIPDLNALHRHGVRFVKWREKRSLSKHFEHTWFAVAASHMRGDELLLIDLVVCVHTAAETYTA